jgi:hypothetical protein
VSLHTHWMRSAQVQAGVGRLLSCGGYLSYLSYLSALPAGELREMHRRAVSVAPQLSPAIAAAAAAAAAARTRRRLDCAPKPEAVAVAVAVAMVQCSGCSGCSARCSGAGVSPSQSLDGMGWMRY